MTHYFNLNDEPFEKIANGTKTIELRLYDEKRQAIKIDDAIVFSNDLGDKVTVMVKALHRFNNFNELYNSLDLLKCGYNKSNVASANYTDMQKYYSVEDINKYGVIGIEFAKVELWDAYDSEMNKINDMLLVRGKVVPNGIYHLVSEIIVKHIDGTYLIMQRDLKKHFGGMWELSAGGSALLGESPLQCATRELKEETGIVANNLKEIGTVVHNEHHSIYFEYMCVTDCDKNSITLQKGETIDFKWIDLKTLKSLDTDELVTTRIKNFVDELYN